MLQMWFEWLEFPFECFESLSNGSNIHSNASNLVQMVRIWIGMLQLQIAFEWFKYAFECFKSGLKSVNLHSNASTPYQMVRI